LANFAAVLAKWLGDIRQAAIDSTRVIDPARASTERCEGKVV
jgi:hypothetical protein